MDPYRIPSSSSSSSFLPAKFDADDKPDQTSQHFMKAPKRKRLAKACDACHKSKRRCDGTAPCSNCYFASKTCSYTDASGRAVPAPRLIKPERADHDYRNALPSSSTLNSQFHPSQDTQADDSDPRTLYNVQQNPNDAPRKRFRNERGSAVATEDISTSLPFPIPDGPVSITLERPASVELDPSLTRELTNLFFTHCHPASAIIHKPTFSASLAHNRVPPHLLHAVCALAAPLSKQPRLRTTPTRFAGKSFAQEAQAIMFDGAGRLLCERNLATAQALCLLQMHDLAIKDRNMFWNSRYHDLAMQIVEGLNVYQPEHPTLTPVPSPEFVQASLERESVRRIFWLIHLMDIMASIYFKKPIIQLGEEGQRLRLPADETSFELGVHSTLPEYLYLPAVRTQYASEFGHLIRVITIYAKVEYALDELNDSDSTSNLKATLMDAEHKLESWAASLPEHLRFSEQSLQVQQSMFETSSNTGAWCYCCMHVYHAASALALNLAHQRLQRNLVKGEPQWAVSTLNLIMNMLGDRAKNSILMGAALWAFIKYCGRDDPQVQTWCAEYEDSWGTRVRELVAEWRPHPSPPLPHQYIPPSHPSIRPPQQLQLITHRNVTDPRSNNPPLSANRISSHQHDSSYNRRSPNSSSPTTFPIGRSLDELRLHSNSNTRTLPMIQSDREIGSHGLAGSGGGGGLSSGQGQGGNGFGNNGNEHMEDKDQEMSFAGGSSSAGEGANTHKNVGSRHSGDGPQSLPSLKSSGLLEHSWVSSRADTSAAHNNGRSSPRRSPPRILTSSSTLHQEPADSRVNNLVSMPVGLSWLANESR